MARKPARIKPKKAKTDLTIEMIEILVNGHSFESLLDWYPGSPFRDENHKRQTWKQYRKYIMQTYKDRTPTDDDENFFPSGSRPAAYWIYDLEIEIPKDQLEYLIKHDLISADELFQVRMNNQTQKLKHRFRIGDKPELGVI